MLFRSNVEYQEQIEVYQDESGNQPAQSVLACSLVGIYDRPAVAPALQVSFVATALFWILALILIIFVVEGCKLMRWLHWKTHFT